MVGCGPWRQIYFPLPFLYWVRPDLQPGVVLPVPFYCLLGNVHQGEMEIRKHIGSGVNT
jgi:hypothetical protein